MGHQANQYKGNALTPLGLIPTIARFDGMHDIGFWPCQVALLVQVSGTNIPY